MSENEFTPTAKDLLNLDEKLIELKTKKNELISAKLSAERTLSVLGNRYNKCEFNSEEFKKIKENRAAVKQDYFKVELQIRTINEEISYKSALRNEVQFHISGKKVVSNINDKAVRQLLTLKEKYNAFAKDHTRVSSMRTMAAQVRDELEKIIDLI